MWASCSILFLSCLFSQSWAPSLVPSGLPPDLSILPLQIFLPFPALISTVLFPTRYSLAQCTCPCYCLCFQQLYFTLGLRGLESLPLCLQFLATSFTFLSATWANSVKTLPLYLEPSLPAPHPTVYMTPISDYNTISHSQAW